MNTATGKVIKAFRLYFNYKHEFISAKINITAGTLANIEHGRVGMDIEKLYKISQLYGVSPSDVLELIVDVFEAPENNEHLNQVIKQLVPDPTKTN